MYKIYKIGRQYKLSMKYVKLPYLIKWLNLNNNEIFERTKILLRDSSDLENIGNKKTLYAAWW